MPELAEVPVVPLVPPSPFVPLLPDVNRVNGQLSVQSLINDEAAARALGEQAAAELIERGGASYLAAL